MKRLYANILGDWVELTVDTATIDKGQSPSVWMQESLQDAFKYDYVNIEYKGKEYRVHPSMLQVVNDND